MEKRVLNSPLFYLKAATVFETPWQEHQDDQHNSTTK